ncbi:general substrate transporter [Umbelopsis sp. PMI_123]|nr:general substrate transporter [Umbelopsis sp. PMI_123]
MKFPEQAMLWQRRQLFSPMLVFATLYVSMAAFNFGYDTSIFSSIQGMTSFTNEFGTYNPTQNRNTIPPYLSSIMNSTPFLGKLIGTLACAPLMEKYGRKSAIIVIAVISIVGSLLQTTAYSAAQYTVGRILCYMATGFTISVVPAYQSETAPAELRGAIGATLQLWIGVGQVIGAVVTNATATMPGREAWLLPTGIQFILPAILVFGFPFVPESPRWLLAKDRRDDAVAALLRLRVKGTSVEDVEYELDLIAQGEQTHGKGPWKDLFKGSDLRRTWIAIGAMVCQQITGQAFVGQYSVVFYQQQNITNPSPYMLGVIGSTTSLVSSLLVSLIIDSFGRRPILHVGSFMITVWLFVLGAMGSIPHPNEVQKNVMVAANMLFGKAYGMSWAPLSYVIMGEVASGRLREKTVNLATSISVILTFLVSFTLPYLLNAPYANLQAKVGYIYGSFSVLTFIFGYFYVPELKNRSLEEVDEIFENKIPARKTTSYVATGIGRQITEAEGAANTHRHDVVEYKHSDNSEKV